MVFRPSSLAFRVGVGISEECRFLLEVPFVAITRSSPATPTFSVSLRSINSYRYHDDVDNVESLDCQCRERSAESAR